MQIDTGLDYVSSLFSGDAFRPNARPPEAASFENLTSWLQRRLDHVGDLEEWIDYAAIREQIVISGLSDYIANLENDRPPVNQWMAGFLKRIFVLWLDDQYRRVPPLGEFRGLQHGNLVRQFRDLDNASLRLAPHRVLYEVLSRRPPVNVAAAAPSEPAILSRELQKRKRHKPIRRLFNEIPNLLTTLKPCLLMSPLSVSQYLDSVRLQFDLVIFDEASQVLPQDAIGAIYRGQQIVVAGDSKQMPPTQFFRSGSGDDAEGEEDDGPLESILDQCIAVGLNESTLRWHYRSRDEDLIAFSNHHFYGGRLVTFPSPTINAPDRGVKFLHVQDGVYDRGGNRTNRIEARRVADLVIAHAEQGSEKSLGVIAFSMNQMLAILEELDTRRRARPDLETFFREDRREPFFVKNLETVQGDERDIIFFSVGYGKDRVGKMAASFGPLNQEGGERRLNVAVTRAREHVKLVSSILPTDIDIQGTRSQGVRLLRQYMEYAMSGVKTLDIGPAISLGAAESPFEESVAVEFQRHGLIIHHQIGCAGFRIDLAVVDRNHPGQYVMGIECDGATYHSSKTARDRDRLRQEVLEGLGWRIHRIWSADWIKDPQGQVKRLLLALEQAYLALPIGADRVRPLPRRETLIATEMDPSDTDHAVRTASVSTVSDATNEGAPSALSQVKLYRETPIQRQSNAEGFYESPREAATIGQLISYIVQQEGPVPVDRVIEWVARCYGFERTGQRIVDRINQVLTSAVRRKTVLRRGDFLWDPGMAEANIPVRRLGPGGKQRAINRIAPEELSRAVILVLQEAFSLPEQDLIIQTARLLGFERTGSIIVDRLNDIVDAMHQQGTTAKVAGYVSRATAINGLAKTP